jgi:ADP-dependent NAD(P)H-hydrate dehydratase
MSAPIAITPALLRRWPLPALDDRRGKVARGQVLVVGGSTEIPGAAMLAAIAALRAGAGTLVIATSAEVAPPLAVAVPEARVIGLRVSRNGELAGTSTRDLRAEVESSDAVLVGPGMRDAGAAATLFGLAARLHSNAVFVVDAGALHALGERRPHRIVITPHVGEMAKLLDEDPDDILADPRRFAEQAAAELGVIAVLKGQVTHIASPDGRTYANHAGNLGLGTSGSGDTLSGVIAGLCARGAEPLQAAAWGVHVHAKAGERLARDVAPLGYLARELLAEVPSLVASFTPRRRR